MNPTRLFAAVALTLLAASLAGCGGGAPLAPTPRSAPPDFALVFTVVADDPEHADADPRRVPAQHVLAADRVLRVALGAGTYHDYYPGPTATLEPRRVAALYRIAAERELMAERTVDDATLATADVAYHVTLRMDGQRHRYRTVPAASPGSVALHEALIELRGGR